MMLPILTIVERIHEKLSAIAILIEFDDKSSVMLGFSAS
jgi:hypothetical protein